jgi:hypothetical protein
VEIPLPQATEAQRLEFKKVEVDPIDTSDLVNFFINTAFTACFRAKRAKALKNLKPITFKQALKHP